MFTLLWIDRVIWKFSDHGNLTVASAYAGIVFPDLPLSERDLHWGTIWKGKGPNRWCTFLWLVRHGRLLTNLEKVRRHISDDDSCPNCSTHSESLMHALRDCFVVSQLWRSLVPWTERNIFFSLELVD